MARNIGPQCRLCRQEESKLYLKGDRCKSDKCPITRRRGKPGEGLRARNKKASDYSIQLREKQKVKRLYGMMEQQFLGFFLRAQRVKGVTGENLLVLLERRLDNMVYRMHFAPSRKSARQLVLHGHVRVNGKKVSVPSYLVREGDEVDIRERDHKIVAIKESLKEYSRSGASPWLEVDPDRLWGKVRALPRRADIADLADINEQLIVELYSK